MRTVTSFDTSKHHIYIDFTVTDEEGNPFELSGVIDTGAPWTELNDAFLAHAGFIVPPDGEIPIKPGLETQKYAKILLPSHHRRLQGDGLAFRPCLGHRCADRTGLLPALQDHHRL